MNIDIREDLVELGYDEDGSMIVASQFYLVAQTARGRRFAHNHCRIDRVRSVNEEGMTCWPRDGGKARADMEVLLSRVQARLAAGGAIDFLYWNEIDPMYGSEAYSALADLGHFREAEMQAAREAGEPMPAHNY